ncbi:MAG: LysM peptidoglycan-binding domain-containing protein [Acidimicrobiia bacterium]
MTGARSHTGAGTGVHTGASTDGGTRAGGPTRCDRRRPRGDERPSTAHAVRLAAWTGGLLVTARVLHATGGAYRVPTGSWRSASEWLGAATPVEIAGAILRLVAIAGVWYLLAATLAALVADRAGRPGLARTVARLTPALVRRTVIRGGGVGLAIGVLVGSALHPDAATAGPGPPAPVLMSLLPTLPGPTAGETDTAVTTRTGTTGSGGTDTIDIADTGDTGSGGRTGEAGSTGGTATMTRRPPPPGAPGVATMTRLPGDGSTARDPGATARPAGGKSPGPVPRPGTSARDRAPEGGSPRAVGATAPGDPDAGAARAGDTWVVAPGDSFWSIATEVIVEVGGARRPRDRDIVPYWRNLIAANRERLVVPDDPDVLLPGQRLLIPTPPPVPRST